FTYKLGQFFEKSAEFLKDLLFLKDLGFLQFAPQISFLSYEENRPKDDRGKSLNLRTKNGI
ncbi:MAG: hypothetical protein J6S69_07370, partial [Proteobacteria bacterium]|nr:hypothetical protein [Pseudomonadota bacterium]